ncbi:hypothetical protein WMY93_000018 [Mugilogobius chulae]|uniref:Uncharacterized protein n=1 Tax=Mugilogobius chulae TaxID=88201 RepID=A0AAW0Q8W5_9GOBI
MRTAINQGLDLCQCGKVKMKQDETRVQTQTPGHRQGPNPDSRTRQGSKPRLQDQTGSKPRLQDQTQTPGPDRGPNPTPARLQPRSSPVEVDFSPVWSFIQT